MQPGVFLDLFTHDQIPKVLLGIEKAILKSFEQDRRPGRIILVTGAADRKPGTEEMKRRGQICVKILKALRGDLSWGVDRMLDQLPTFLRKELDGESWEAEARMATWTPG